MSAEVAIIGGRATRRKSPPFAGARGDPRGVSAQTSARADRPSLTAAAATRGRQHRSFSGKPGGRVRINDRMSPRYLAGLDATVIGLDEHAATIRLQTPIGRFTSGRVLALEKLG